MIKGEHPRPDFMRNDWVCLNGPWDFAFDPEDQGEKERWQDGKCLSQKITVPFCCECEASGIGVRGGPTVFWYHKEIEIPKGFEGKRVFLNFCAVDYHAKVWANGNLVAEHRGGYTPFSAELTHIARPGESVSIYVRVQDDPDCTQPRGKQYWKNINERCWYSPSSGIWQTVWLEARGKIHFDSLRLTPDIDRRLVLLEFSLSGFQKENLKICCNITLNGQQILSISQAITCQRERIALSFEEPNAIYEFHYWTPERPTLFDVELVLLQDDLEMDTVQSYFGMRKVEYRNGMFLLNNTPYFQRLVLDQGYWKETLLTAPDDEALKNDILFAKQMGFNGCRKHQKIEEARFYYWADKLGFLVWGEMPAAPRFGSQQIYNVMREFMEFIERDYNHPSLITWVPLNESWGVRNIYVDSQQQNFAAALYHTAKALDPIRLVSSNDGWEQITDTDIYGLHDYTAYEDQLIANYNNPKDALERNVCHRMSGVQNIHYDPEKPIMVTEYGGIAFTDPDGKNWGYNGSVTTQEEFLNRYDNITTAFKKLPYVWGYCYTQLTDVFQEINGLMTMDRKFKVDPNAVLEINERMVGNCRIDRRH